MTCWRIDARLDCWKVPFRGHGVLELDGITLGPKDLVWALGMLRRAGHAEPECFHFWKGRCHKWQSISIFRNGIAKNGYSIMKFLRFYFNVESICKVSLR